MFLTASLFSEALGGKTSPSFWIFLEETVGMEKMVARNAMNKERVYMTRQSVSKNDQRPDVGLQADCWREEVVKKLVHARTYIVRALEWWLASADVRMQVDFNTYSFNTLLVTSTWSSTHGLKTKIPSA